MDGSIQTIQGKGRHPCTWHRNELKSHTESFLPTKGPRTPSLSQPQRSTPPNLTCKQLEICLTSSRTNHTPLLFVRGSLSYVTTRPEGLALVVFHRAHQRVIYDHFLLQHETKSIEQLTTLPDYFLPKSDQEALNPVLSLRIK